MLKSCFLYFRKKYKEYCLNKYHTSIKDLLLVSWIGLLTEKDLKYLLKDKKKKVDKYALDVYLSIQNQVVDEFGVGKEFLSELKNEVKIQLLYIKQVQTGDMTTQIHIDRLKDKVDQIRQSKKEGVVDVFESIIHLEKSLGFKLDPNTMTVFQFYKYADVLSKNA